jgi:hypothetical protein
MILGRRTHAQRGQALPEFGLAAIVVMTFFFGIIVSARAIFAYDMVANAARMGARYAIVRGTGCTVSGCPATATSIQTYLLSENPGLATTNLQVKASWATAPGCTDANQQGRACLVTVQVVYPFRFSYPLNWTTTITGSSSMVISQ